VTDDGYDNAISNDIMPDGGEKGNMIGKINEKLVKQQLKDSKHRKTSRFVPGHQLESEAEPTPPLPKKQKTSTAMARTMATNTFPLPDKLWPDSGQCPMPMCDTCEGRGLSACITLGLQMACLSCHARKTKCSHSTLCTAC
jgi:hypothetical protein